MQLTVIYKLCSSTCAICFTISALRLPGYAMFAGILLVSAGGALFKANDRYLHPLPQWFSTERWYETAINGLANIVIAFMILRYRSRRIRNTPTASDATGWKRPWFERKELRSGLWFIAAIHVVKAIAHLFAEADRYYAPNPFQSPPSFNPWESIIYLLVAVLIVRYDRYRLRMSERISEGLCLKCGYDLRATPHCCPECGTSVDRVALRRLAERMEEPSFAAPKTGNS